ncbi:MAG TPA: hypothetical protein PLM98_11665, partial [Thiolinea sp.]|nr:hypothetical protein [Thiolinea sp.]
MRVFLPVLLFATSILVLSNPAAATTETQIIPVVKLKAAPLTDGSDADWKDIQGVEIPLVYLGKPGLVKNVLLKAGVYGDEVYFYSEWDDSTEDILHKPHIWDEAQQKYVEGPQREDRFAGLLHISAEL